MERKIKGIFTVIMIGMLIFTNRVFTYASEAKKDSSVPEVVIGEYFNSMGNDWDTFAELYTSQQVEGFKNFLHNKDNVFQNTGVLNVKNAILQEAVEIKYEDVKLMLRHNDYSEEEIKTYAVGVEFQVNEDTKYFSNGISYYLIVLVNENGNWKVSELLQIPDPEELRKKGYIFNDEYSITEQMMQARQTGYLMNGYGEIFADIDGNPVEDVAIPLEVINKRTVPTANTTISYGVYDSKYNFKSKKDIKYHDYCLGVTAGEVRGVEFDGEARRAVIIAIKTYTWHYKIVPIDSVNGVDIKNTMQAYMPDYVSENSVVTTDYNAMKNIWMESYSGAIFEALYKAGSYNDDRETLPGQLMQEGCRYLVNECGKNLYECLHYYYDNTEASVGGPVRFFNSQKVEINK